MSSRPAHRRATIECTLRWQVASVIDAQSTAVEIRPLDSGEVDAFLALCLALDSDTDLMMLEPGERQGLLDQQRREVSEAVQTDNSTIIVASDRGVLVGYVAAYGGAYRRNRHSVDIVAGVLQSHAGQGLGRRLLEDLIGWAQGHGVSRLQLTTMMHNEPALRLYTRMGFEVEGVRRNSLIVEGQPVDEVAMALILDRPAR